jgi:tetratricopeptide (TPR) repeat protein
MARRDRREEARISELIERSDMARLRDDADNAISLRREANTRARALAERFGNDPRHEQSIAGSLYTIGAVAIEYGRPAEAVEALDESQQLYEALGSRGALTSLPFVCDVRARRARALVALGRGASAVVDADGAVRGYWTLVEGMADDHPRHLDLARVLTAAALIQYQFGDPDLAVGAADTVIRMYLARASAINRSPDMAEHARYMIDAVIVAERVHRAHGRTDLAAAAQQMFQQIVPSAEHRSIVAAAVVSPHATLVAPGASLPSTLARVLATHDQELAQRTTRPAVECAIQVPSERAPGPLAYLAGIHLAGLVDSVSAPADQLRVGLEAHWVLAAASEQQTFEMRYSFEPAGLAWMKALLTCSSLLEQAGDFVLALDLMSWAAGVAQQLLPHGFANRGTADAVHDCHERHARLLAASGDHQAAEQALHDARQIRALFPEAEGS